MFVFYENGYSYRIHHCRSFWSRNTTRKKKKDSVIVSCVRLVVTEQQKPIFIFLVFTGCFLVCDGVVTVVRA